MPTTSDNAAAQAAAYGPTMGDVPAAPAATTVAWASQPYPATPYPTPDYQRMTAPGVAPQASPAAPTMMRPSVPPPRIARAARPVAPTTGTQRVTAAPPPLTQASVGGEGFPTPQTDIEIPASREIDSATIIARVDSDVILAADVMPFVEMFLEENAERIPPGREQEYRQLALRQRLVSLLQTKAAYSDAKRSLPEEAIAQVEKRVGDIFDRERLPEMLRTQDLHSRAELEDKLQELGSSIEREKRAFIERELAANWLSQKTRPTATISREEMLAYYHEHISEYEYPAQVRWQQLLVRHEAFATSQEARRRAAELGNQILAGASFEDIARAHSGGDRADEGGMYDWTDLDLQSGKPVPRALAELPVGALSQILEDHQGFHIIRVLERRPAGRVPFFEAQVGIRDKIRDARRDELRSAEMREIMQHSKIWTIFDDVERIARQPDTPQPQ